MRKFVILVALLTLVALPVMGQVRTGNIYGKVVDATSGQPLPGVAITLTGEKIAPITTISSAEGNFRFLSLPPGTYAIKAELQGFKTVVRKGIRVVVGADVNIVLKMEEGTIKEEVTVTAAAPVVDTRKATVAANVTKEALQELPTARDPWVILELAPGVMVDRANVGGSESGQQSNFTRGGAMSDDNQFNIDGVNITDPAAVGASPMYYDFDMFEEMQIELGANDVTAPTGGIIINFVTRRGGNRISGGARVYFTNKNFQSEIPISKDNFMVVTLPDKTIYNTGNKINKIADYGFNLGGPLIKDKLWFWGSYGVQDIRQLAITGDPDNTWLETINAKLNAQIGQHRIELYYIWSNKEKQGRRRTGGYVDAREATFNQTGPTTVYKFQDEFTIGNFFGSIKLSHVGGGFELDPIGGKENPVFYYRLASGVSRMENSGYYYYTERPQYAAEFLGDYFIENLAGGNHEIKFGVEYKTSHITSTFYFGGNTLFYHSYSYPDNLYIAILFPTDFIDYTINRFAAYAQDTMTYGRLTINLGVRYDKQWGWMNNFTIPPSNAYWLPADKQFTGAEFPKSDGPIWNFISPRFNINYDISGDGKTVVKLSAALYGSQYSAGELYIMDPIDYYYPERDMLWIDADGDKIVDPGEIVSDWGVYGPKNPDGSVKYYWSPEDVIDPNLTSPKTLEVLFGIEHELLPNFGVGLNLSYRKLWNFTWGKMLITPDLANYRFAQPEDWQVVEYVNGMPYYDIVTADGAWYMYDYLTNRPDYYQDYKGLEIIFNKRLANKWMLNGSLTLMDWRVHFPTRASYQDPTNHETPDGDLYDNQPAAEIARGSGAVNVHMNARWMFKLGGLYQLPYDFNISFTFIAREGYITPQVASGETRTYRAKYDSYAYATVLVKPYGSHRLPTYWMLNLRLEKKINIGKAGRAYLSLDGFNITNNCIKLAEVGDVNSENYGKYLANMSPRVFRIGFRYEF